MTGFISSFSETPLELPPDQPLYPRRDLDSSAIPFLNAMIGPDAVLQVTHAEAERKSRMYLMAHAVISRLEKYSYALSPEQVRLASVGAAHYEAASRVVEGHSPRTYHESIAAPTALSKLAASPAFKDEHYRINEQFEYTMPQLRDFLKQMLVTRRHISTRTVDYALVGAALQHHTELQAMSAQEAFEFEEAMGLPRTLGDYDADDSI